MPAAQPELQRELRQLAVTGMGVLLVMTVMLFAVVGATFALRWILSAAACWSVVLWQCYRRLDKNCSTSGATPYTRLGTGTRVTLLRGLLIAATAGFLLTTGMETPPLLYYVPAILYTAAALGDALDGYLARRQQHTTELGRQLDMALDALGLLLAPLLAILYGKLHFSYLLVSLAYYLFHLGIYRRRQHGLPVYPLPPSRSRRLLAGFQMGLVATVLWPPLPAEVTRVAGVLFMLPMLAGFVRDWLYVSGRRKHGRDPRV